MLVLRLVRHGETAWNAEGRFQGRNDVPLSEVGREQARVVAAALARRPVAAVYTSDLSRAVETAALVAAPHGIEPVADARLREMDFGDWEGMTGQEIAIAWAEAEKTWNDDPRPPGGESYPELQRRVGAALADVAAAHAGGGEVVLVTHGAALRAAVAVALDARVSIYRRLKFDNGSITTMIARHGGFTIACLNDTCHLAVGGCGLAG